MGGQVIEVEVAGVRFLLRKDLRYTESDEWARLEDGVATVGITDFAQKELKDIVGVELPEKGRKVKKGEAVATVESIKATADIYAPLSGEIVDVNEKLLDQPELINDDPYGEGWIFKIKVEDPGEFESLLTPEQYVESVRKRKE
ncbi:glycine cleavage system H protein [Aeropyrum pernix K1]|uniref:Probable glycine cleavage system H protein n=1 Tax=Aeropyrum pernix (strain ATCC 700893 / DSM 11879 / JCM 9820 / NBRC 100138 / K1) TaxID=272557 RepID=GCSH_AERPE|nr:glycine cleavage system protein GcvH [Aeropyrum pernix]Q9YDG2.2 RecName: Full=Probable glycine cleavage system H protein [Aeropyrum pernix K1]BAA79935.2 glycine cleavage system H protein [Aeropyrum pernix K1]